MEKMHVTWKGKKTPSLQKKGSINHGQTMLHPVIYKPSVDFIVT